MLRSLGPGVVRCYAAVILINTADGVVSTIASPYLRHLGFPLSVTGLVIAVYAIASFASRMPTGRVVETRFASYGFVLACVLLTASLLLYPVATVPWAMAADRVLHGLSFGAATTLNFAAFLGSVGRTHQARATAFYAASMSGGYAIGNTLAGVIADNSGYTAAFLVGAVSPLLAILVRPDLRPVPRLAAAADAAGSSLLAPLRNPQVWAVPVVAFCVSYDTALLAILFPLYALAVGVGLGIAGTARGLQSLSNMVIRPFGGVLSSRFGTAGLGAGGVALAGFTIAAITFLTSPALLLGSMVVVGLGRAGGVIASQLGAVHLSERGILKRGTASALVSAGGDLGNVVAPMVAGFAAQHLGLARGMQVQALAAVALGVGTVLATSAWRRPAPPTPGRRPPTAEAAATGSRPGA